MGDLSSRDEGAAPFEMLAWAGRKMGKKVMLISDGPDELCGGYPIDLRAYNQKLDKNETGIL